MGACRVHVVTALAIIYVASSLSIIDRMLASIIHRFLAVQVFQSLQGGE